MFRFNKILAVSVSGAAALVTWTMLQGCNKVEVKAVAGFPKDVAEIIIRKCTPCHAGGKSENGLGFIDKPGLLVERGYIIPGDHAASLLYKKVSPTPPYGDRMPKGGPYLSNNQLAIIANWIDNIDDPAAAKFDVTISASPGISVDPVGTIAVSKNKSIAITVKPDDGVTVSGTVGGTCPVGSWSGLVYTTGKITAACSVVFTKNNEAVVSASGTGVSLDLSSVTLETGAAATFAVTVRANDTMVYDLTSITGSCPKGGWDTSSTPKKYTTGAITSSCTVVFSTQNPCPTVVSASFADVQGIMMGAANCAGCHDGDGEKADFTNISTAGDLKSVALLIDGNAGRVLVDPTKPLSSVLYLNVTADRNLNGQMPQRGPYLSSGDQSKICNWILDGAN